MDREIRYCTSTDGTRIAYSVEGEGPVLLECPGLWGSFANKTYNLDVYLPIRQGRTIVEYDFRGVGLSQRDAKSYTLECMTADIDAVVRSANLDRFALWGSQVSAAPAILHAVRHPEQVSRLILGAMLTGGPEVMPRATLDALVQLIRNN